MCPQTHTRPSRDCRDGSPLPEKAGQSALLFPIQQVWGKIPGFRPLLAVLSTRRRLCCGPPGLGKAASGLWVNQLARLDASSHPHVPGWPRPLCQVSPRHWRGRGGVLQSSSSHSNGLSPGIKPYVTGKLHNLLTQAGFSSCWAWPPILPKATPHAKRWSPNSVF